MQNFYMRVVLALLIGLHVSACNDASTKSSPSEETNRATSIADVPAKPKPSFAIEQLLGADRGALKSVLGPPEEDDPEQESFEIDGFSITAYYRRNKAARLLVRVRRGYNGHDLAKLFGLSDGMTIGNIQYELEIADGDDFGGLFINAMKLPAQPPPIMKLLGQPQKKVEKVLGKPEISSTWIYRDEGYMLRIAYADDHLVREVSISFDPGVRPSEREEEIFQWLDLPQGRISVGKKICYVVSMDRISISFRRRYICS